MSVEAIRTQENIKNLVIGGSGRGIAADAADFPFTIDNDVQFVAADNTGGSATGVITVPAPNDYVGSAEALTINITADLSTEDVTIAAPPGIVFRTPTGSTSVIVGTTRTFTANTLVKLYKVDPTTWGVFAVAL